MKMELIKKTLVFKQADEISAICAPLFKNSPVKFYSHIRRYANEQVTGVASQHKWLLHFLAKDYIYADISNADFSSIQPGSYILDNTFNEKIMTSNTKHAAITKDMHDYNLAQRLIIIDKTDHYMDSYLFGAPVTNDRVAQFYHEQKMMFLKFIYYFKDKIQQDNSLRKYLDVYQHKLESSHDFFNTYINIDDNLSRQFNSKRIYFVNQNKNEYLTLAEIKILTLLLQYNTAKEIAKILNLSYRTVEKHVEHMKLKTNTSSTRELCKFFYELKFDEIKFIE